MDSPGCSVYTNWNAESAFRLVTTVPIEITIAALYEHRSTANIVRKAHQSGAPECCFSTLYHVELFDFDPTDMGVGYLTSSHLSRPAQYLY